MKTCLFAQRFYVLNLCKGVLDSLLLSDGSTRNGVIGTMKYVVNQQEMVAFRHISELKAI